MLNVQIISGRNASLNFYIRHPISSVLLLFFTHSQGPASRVTHFLHPPALQREREHQQFRGSGDDGWWRRGQAEEEQEEKEEEQHDLHLRGARKDEHAGLQAGEDGLFFPIGRRDGQVTSRVGRKHQRKMSRAMTLPLHDLCLPLAVKEAGVPQWHQPVWAQSGKCVTDQRQL